MTVRGPDGQQDILPLNEDVGLPLEEIELIALRSSGPGGQHVNTTSSAIELRFDVAASSLPPECKARLLESRDRRLSRDGVFVIKSQQHRSQIMNRRAALERLVDWIGGGLAEPLIRKPTRVSRAARQRRLEAKTQRGVVKRLRGRIRRGREPD